MQAGTGLGPYSRFPDAYQMLQSEDKLSVRVILCVQLVSGIFRAPTSVSSSLTLVWS